MLEQMLARIEAIEQRMSESSRPRGRSVVRVVVLSAAEVTLHRNPGPAFVVVTPVTSR